MHLKLKDSPIVCLVGFMGCGKSTVGPLLAARLGWVFVDLDEEIERSSGSSVSEMFEREGEAAFRDREHQALGQQLTLARQGRPRVLALGGGAFAEPRNRQGLEAGGISIWLECPPEKLWPRVAGWAHRPLARDPETFRRLYEERRPSYQGADFTVSCDTEGPRQVVETILRLPLWS